MGLKFEIPSMLAVAIGLLILTDHGSATTYQIDPVSDYYNIRAEYDARLATPGNKYLELKITMSVPTAISVPDSERLILANCQSTDEQRIKIESRYDENKTSEGFRLKIHYFHVDIPRELEARTYRIKLQFKYEKYPGRVAVGRDFPLNVGVWRDGKLHFEMIGEPRDFESGLISKTQGSFKFRLVNTYPDYVVNIQRINIDSTIPWLVEGIAAVENIQDNNRIERKTILFDPPINLVPGQDQPFDIKLNLGRIHFTNLISGFSSDTKLIFDITYDDSNERTIRSYAPDARIKLKPDDAVLLCVLIIGVLIGTGFKAYLEHLRETGAVSRKGLASFVLSTVLVGVVIAIIAWAGEIKIIAFKDIDLSYDKPIVIGLMGMFGALAGVHYLQTIYRWARKKAAAG